MQSTADVEPKELLYLAAITYSGFGSALPARVDASGLKLAIDRGLARPPVLGKWRLVWGPASFRAHLSLFDDVATYVLRSTTGGAPRYVVAIRATNPASGFDWLLGDFWVSQLRPWPYGSERSTACISLSTSFGLAALQSLQANAPAGIPPNRDLDAPASHRSRLLDLPAISWTRVSSLRAKLAETLRAIETRRGTPAPLEMKLQFLVDDWQSSRRREALELVRDAEDQFRQLGDRAHEGLFALLENDVQSRDRLSNGHDLLSFLRTAVREAGDQPVEVLITGHSKGGALATAVALWLHETGGDGGPEEERWDPKRRATVRCFTFAGPTAGNRGFAERVEDRLGTNYRRFANALDIVPRGFVPEQLERLARVYGPSVQAVAGLKEVVALVADEIRPLAYTHAFPLPGDQFTEIAGEVDLSKRLYLQQAIHQHLDGYLAGVGLAPPMKAWTFFNPMA